MCGDIPTTQTIVLDGLTNSAYLLRTTFDTNDYVDQCVFMFVMDNDKLVYVLNRNKQGWGYLCTVVKDNNETFKEQFDSVHITDSFGKPVTF